MGVSATLLQDYQRANNLPITHRTDTGSGDPTSRAPGRFSARQDAVNAARKAEDAKDALLREVKDEARAKEALAAVGQGPGKPPRIRAPRVSKSAKKAVEDISKKLPKSLSAAFNPQTFGDLINQQVQAVEDTLTDVKSRLNIPAAKAKSISSRMRAKIVELTQNPKYTANLPNLLATPISQISDDIVKSMSGLGKGLVDDLSEGISNKKSFLTPDGTGERRVATKGWKARIDSALTKIKEGSAKPTRAIADGLMSNVLRDALKAAEEGLDDVGAQVASDARTVAASVPGANKPKTVRVRTPKRTASIPLDPVTMLPLDGSQLQPMASDETSKKKKNKIVGKAAEAKAASEAAAAAQIAADEASAAQLVADKASAEAAIKEEKRLATNAKRRAANAAKKAALSTQVSAAQIATEVAATTTSIPPLTIPNRIPVLNTLSPSKIAEQIADYQYFADEIRQESINQAIDPLGTYAGKKTVKQSLSSTAGAFSAKAKSLAQSLSGVPEKISAKTKSITTAFSNFAANIPVKGKAIASSLSSVAVGIANKGKLLTAALAGSAASLIKAKGLAFGSSVKNVAERMLMSPFGTGTIGLGSSKRGYLDIVNEDMTGARGARGLRNVLGQRGQRVFEGMSEARFESFGEGKVKARALGKGLTPNFNEQGIIESFRKAKRGAESVNISLAEGDKILRRRFLPSVRGLDDIFKSKSASRYFKLSTVGFGPSAISGFKSISKYIKDIPNSHDKALKAVDALKTKYSQLGKTAPGAIRRSATYANSILPAGDMLKGGLSKISSIFMSIISMAVKFAFTFLLIAPIIILVVGLLGKMKEAIGRNGPAFQNLKDALKNVKEAFYALAKPLITLFLGFGGVENKMIGLGTEGEKVAAVFYIFSKAIKNATEKFLNFAKGKTAQEMMTALGEITVRLINRFILLGGAIKSLFGGDKEAAGKKFKAFLVSLIYEVIAMTQLMALALSKAFDGLALVIAPIIAGLMNAFIVFFKWLVQSAADTAILVGKSLGDGIKRGIAFVATQGISELMRPGGKLSLQDEFEKPEASGLSSNIPGHAPTKATSKEEQGVLDAVGKIAAALSSGTATALANASNALGNLNDKVAAKFREITGFDINAPMVGKIKGGAPEIIAAIKYVTAKAGDIATAGGESLGSKIAQGIKQKMQDIKQEFADKVFANLDSKVDKIIDKYKSAIDKQKDIYLKAYDDQIAGLDALEEAESSLTDKMEYEINRREKIKNREQDSENYRRERKLAIYEGRIEDVRRLDQQEYNASDSHNKDLSDLDLSENKRLSAEQREIVKAAINKEKRLQEKRFDSLIENYSELIDKIKEKGFTTQEEFQAMMTAITDQTDKTGVIMAESFTTSMLALPAAIASVRDKSIPLFASIGTAAVGSIEDLINKAKTKFGLEADVNNPSSMLGAAWKLANGSSDAFAAAFNATLYAKYVTEAFAEVEKVTKRMFTPGDPLNVAEAWKNAGESAFTAIQTALNRALQFDKIMDSFKAFIEKLKPIVDKVVAQTEKMKSALESVGKVSATPAPVMPEEWQAAVVNQIMNQSFVPSDTTIVNGKRVDSVLGAQKRLSVSKAVAWIGTNYPLNYDGMIDALPKSNLNVSEQGYVKTWLKSSGIAPSPTTGSASGLAQPVIKKYFGGYAKKYSMGGMAAYNLGSYIDRPSNIGVPALLHGGEYIINHKAVERYGKSNLAAINDLRHGGKLPGFAKGGYVGVADAMERRALGKSNAPTSLFGRMKDNPMGYIKGFAKETLRPKNLFPMIGGIAGAIAGSAGFGVGAVPGSIAGATIGGTLGEATEQLFGKFVSKTRENINVGNIVKHGLFSGVADLAALGVGKFILKPIANAVKPILKTKFPGVGTYLEEKIAKPLLNFFKEPKIKSFDPSTLNPDNIIDMVPKQSDLLPALGNPPKRLALPKGTGRPVIKFGQGTETDAPSIRSAFFGEGGAFDKQVLELFDELDTITSGTHRSLPTQIRRDLIKAQLQIKGLIPTLTQSPEESYAYNKMIDEILGLGNNYTGTASAGYGEMLEQLDLSALTDNPFIIPVDDIVSNVPRPKPPISRYSDPREILQSSEVSEFQALMRKNAFQLAKIMRTKGIEERSLMASSRGVSPEQSEWLLEHTELLLPMKNQPLDFVRMFGPESPFKTGKNLQNIFAMKLAEQMRFAPKQIGPGGGGGALVPYKPFSPSSLNLTPKTVRPSFGINKSNDWRTDSSQVDSYPGFDIGNIMHIFGSTDPFMYDNPLRFIDDVRFNPGEKIIRNIPSNPYALSGLPFDSVAGRKVALDYHAIIGNLGMNYKDGLNVLGRNIKSAPQVDALLYAGSRGDLIAMAMFDQLAKDSTIALQSARIRSNGLVIEGKEFDIENLLENVTRYNRFAPLAKASEFAELLSAGKINEVMNMLTLVHERPGGYPFELGKDGDLFLKPTGDFYQPGSDASASRKFRYGPETPLSDYIASFKLDNESLLRQGLEERKLEDYLSMGHVKEGLRNRMVEMEVYRNSIHFGINSFVDGHMARQQQSGEILVANMKAVFDANPGAFDVAYAVDSYFTPRNSAGLRIPKGSFEIVRPRDWLGPSPDWLMNRVKSDRDGFVTNSNYTAEEQMLKVIKSGTVADAIERMGGYKWESGVHYSSEQQDSVIRLLSRHLNVSTGLHSNHIASMIEGFTGNRRQSFNLGLDQLTQMSPNAIARILTDNRKSYTKPMYDPDNQSATSFLPPIAIGAGGILASLFAGKKEAQAMPTANSESEKYQQYVNQIRSLSEFIATGESSLVQDPYSAWYGGKNMMMSGMTSMTINDVIAQSNQRAVGKYQNMPKYLLQRALLANLKGSDLYDEKAQEAIQIAMLMEKSPVSLGLKDFMTGKMNTRQAVNKIANTWLSMPQLGGEYVGGGSNPKGFDSRRKDLVIKNLLEQVKNYYPGYKKGGYVGYANGGAVPAVLHGGEYVLNAKSVAKIGIPQLQAMNAMKFATPNVSYNTPNPQISNYPTGQISSSVSNVNIYVDNFIGEPEWFKGMMSQYNTKILPGKQKSAGLENRVISTYTGLNGGK